MPDQTPLQSLIACGTKLWLDSVDPEVVAAQPRLGRHRRHLEPDHHRRPHQDRPLRRADDRASCKQGLDDEDIAWQLTDMLVRQAQEVFLPVWEETKGDDGYVSFELDPLLEDPNQTTCRSRSGRKQYIALGKKWSTRPQEPHDQGAGHAGRARRPRRTGRRRRHAQRHADLLASGNTRGPRRHLARRPAAAVAGRLQVGLQHLRQPARRVHREARAASCRRRRRAWSASSTPSASGG